MDNKKEINLSVHHIPGVEKVDNKTVLRNGYWAWSPKNDYPDLLYSWFESSSIHGSIIRSKSNYVSGSGLYTESPDEGLQAFMKSCNRKGDTLQEVIEKCSLDYLIYGCFAVNPVWTLGTGKIKELFYVDVATLRYDKEKTHLIQSPDWSKGLRNSTFFPVFNLEEKKGSQIFYYNGKSKGLYGTPSYSGAIEDIQANISISRYHKNKVKTNNFADLYIEIYGDKPSEEERKLIEKKFSDKFTGENSGNSIMFGYPGEPANGTKIQAIDQADQEGKRYIALRDSIRDAIISAHQITSSSLLAIPSPGLSFDSQFREAYNIFMNVVINPLQEAILKPFIKLLEINFKAVSLKLKPLPVIENHFTDEKVISEYMTEEEVREDLYKSGRIRNKEYRIGTLNKDKEEKSGSIDKAITDVIKSNTNAA